MSFQPSADSKPGSLLGQQVLQRRAADGLSQADLGQRFGVTAPTIRSWEHGGSVQKRHREVLAEYLGLTVAELRRMEVLPPQRHLSLVQPGVSASETEDAVVRDEAQLAIQESALRCLSNSPTKEQALLALGLLLVGGLLSRDDLQLLVRGVESTSAQDDVNPRPPTSP